MRRYSAHLSVVFTLLLVMPAFATHGGNTDNIGVQQMRNGDGTVTIWLTIESLPEVAFMEMSITGDLMQVDGGATYDAISASPWAPSVVFTSDATLASALSPAYAANAHLDTVVDDTYWPGKVSVELTPPAGSGGNVAGTQMVRVALTSFTGGVGGPLPGGPIPLAHITTQPYSYRDIIVQGRLQSDSDQDGTFYYSTNFADPEPSSALLAGLGALAVIASSRRRRK